MRLLSMGLGLLAPLFAAASPAAQDLRPGVPLMLQVQDYACDKLDTLKADAPEDATAALFAGAAMEFGLCGPADLTAAVTLYEHAARMQKGQAMIRLGAIHLHGRAGNNDPLRADLEFRSAAFVLSFDDAQVFQLERARVLEEATGEAVDLSMFEAAFQSFGLPPSGPPGETDFTNVVLYLEPGDKEAMAALRAAFGWQRAIARGPASLKHIWAMRLRGGEGIRHLPERAIGLLQDAYGQDSSDSRIAYDYAHATIHSQSHLPGPSGRELGVLLIASLAKGGFAPAQLDIGLWMAHGLNGVKKNPAGAYPWLLLALDGGLEIEGLVERLSETLPDDVKAAAEAFDVPRGIGGIV